MKCPACNHEWKLPGPQAGGRKGGKKGFAAVTAERDAIWAALKWLCWDDCPHCCGSFEKCPRYQDVIKSEGVTPQR